MANINATALQTAIDANAELVVSALSELDVMAGKTADTIRGAFQSMVDTFHVVGGKREEKSIKAFGDMVRAAFVDAVASGMLEQKTVTEYAQGAMRAAFHGVEWSPRLKNDKDAALPWGKVKAADKAEGSRVAKPSKAQAVTPDALRAGLAAQLATARTLGFDDLAAGILDLMLERWPDFKAE